VEIKSEKARGSWIDLRGADVPLATWAEEFMRLSRRLSPTTQQTYRRDLGSYVAATVQGVPSLGRLRPTRSRTG
jgi:hypothetical protein